MAADVFAVIGFGAVIAGIWLTFGPGWALIVGGLFVMVGATRAVDRKNKRHE